MWQARDRAAQDQDSGELRELRGLNAHEAKVQPPPGAVYLGSYTRHEYEDEAYQYDQVQGRGILAPRGTGWTSGYSSPHSPVMCGELLDERVSPLGVSGELVEACAPGREQDDVTWPGKLYSSCNGLLQVGGPVDYALEALIFEVGGDAWTCLTLAHDRPAYSQGRQHLREVGVLLRATEDQHYRYVEALQGRCHCSRVGSLGIIHVSHSRHPCRDPHAMRPGLVFEQSLSDLPQLRTKPLCGGRREERVFVVVRPCEAQLGHLCQMRAAEK